MSDLNTKVALERARNVNQLGGCGRIAAQLAVDYLELHKEHEKLKARLQATAEVLAETELEAARQHALAVELAKQLGPAQEDICERYCDKAANDHCEKCHEAKAALAPFTGETT